MISSRSSSNKAGNKVQTDFPGMHSAIIIKVDQLLSYPAIYLSDAEIA